MNFNIVVPDSLRAYITSLDLPSQVEFEFYDYLVEELGINTDEKVPFTSMFALGWHEFSLQHPFISGQEYLFTLTLTFGRESDEYVVTTFRMVEATEWGDDDPPEFMFEVPHDDDE